MGREFIVKSEYAARPSLVWRSLPPYLVRNVSIVYGHRWHKVTCTVVHLSMPPSSTDKGQGEERGIADVVWPVDPSLCERSSPRWKEGGWCGADENEEG